MQRIPRPIPASALPVTPTLIYAAPAGGVATISNLSLTNTSTSEVSVTLYAVAAEDVASLANEILHQFRISPGQTYVPPQAIGLQLGAVDSLQAMASADAVIVICGGVYETSGF